MLYIFSGLICLFIVPTPHFHFKFWGDFITHGYASTVFTRNLLECLQFEISSLVLSSVDILGLQIIKHFSHKHKLYLLLTLEYDQACFNFHHLMLYKIFLSFRPHTYLLNSIACLYLSFLNEHTLFPYLNLKGVRKDQCGSLLSSMSWLQA